MKKTFVILLSLLPALAHAHAVGLSQGSYATTSSGAQADITLTQSEIEAVSEGPVENWVAERIDAPGCQLAQKTSGPAENDGISIHLEWQCDATPDALTLNFLRDMPAGHRHLVDQRVFHASSLKLTLEKSRRVDFIAMIRLGFEHILSGLDHLLFIFGMVLVLSRVKPVLKVVTAFTVAHSVTLAVSCLGLLSPNANWVEPLIALSIAYIGVENYFLKDGDKRWRVAFLFGLLHGFGFAGGLKEIGAVAQLPWALLGFNIGVEAGQLAVLAVIWPLLSLLRRSQNAWPRMQHALSLVLIVPGLVWFFSRL